MNSAFVRVAFALITLGACSVRPGPEGRVRARALAQRHEILKVVDGHSRLVKCGASASKVWAGDGLICKVTLTSSIPKEVGPNLTPADSELERVFDAIRADLIESDWVLMIGCGDASGPNDLSYSVRWSRESGWLLNSRGWGSSCSR